MKRLLIPFSFLIIFSFSGFAQADKIIGKWKTIDDKDGSAKSIVSIYKGATGKYCGKIEKLFKDPEKRCTECEGSKKDQPIVGMIVINDMIEKDGKLTGGTILDPKTGKIYKCNITLDKGTEKINVRGSLDKGGWIGRTQTWIRTK